MIYIDTSALIASLTSESRAEDVRRWMGQQAVGELTVSGWTETEIAGALARKVRTRDLTVGQCADAAHVWKRLRDTSLNVITVTSADFLRAAGFAGRNNVALRSADALHLAIAASGGHRLLTLDRRMVEAARSVGIEVEALA
jgi:uncharacterized protein